MWKSASPGSWHRAVWTTPYDFLTYWTQPLLSVLHFSDMLLALLSKSKMISPRAFAQTAFLLIPSIVSGLEGCSLIPVKPLGYWPAEFWLKLLHTGKQPQKIRDLFYRRVNWWVSRFRESGHSWGEGRGKSCAVTCETHTCAHITSTVVQRKCPQNSPKKPSWRLCSWHWATPPCPPPTVLLSPLVFSAAQPQASV